MRRCRVTAKTEMAMRAAFKAMEYGKQVAVLVPTTVLAEQHFRSFKSRMAEFPFIVDSISRVRSTREQKETLKKLAAGEVDLLIGTHRLISKDVKFSRSWAGRHRRRTALWCDPQRTIQADAKDRGCADDVGHAHSAHAAYEHGGSARYQFIDHRAAGSPQRCDRSDALRSQPGEAGDSPRAAAAKGRSISFTTASTTSSRWRMKFSNWCPMPAS